MVSLDEERREGREEEQDEEEEEAPHPQFDSFSSTDQHSPSIVAIKLHKKKKKKFQ